MGDAVQIRQGLFVGKDDISQGFALQLAIFHHAGEAVFDGLEQGGILCQQAVVDGVAIQNQAALFTDALQQGGFSAAAAAGNANDHASSSVLTMQKPAALFSRFWTA